MASLLDQKLGCATVLFGEGNGKYPDANCVLVEGSEERVLLDTTPGLVARGRSAIGAVDRILMTHAHEDHLAGNFLFPEASIHAHSADLLGMQSVDGMMEIYGGDQNRRKRMVDMLVNDYNYRPRPDAVGFEAGAVFDLGGGTTIEVIHTPGHTRGHCAFFVRPENLLFLGDVDLSGFGPYYGDAWSDLEDFERTIEALRDVEAHFYLSGHHIGLIRTREAYIDRIDRYRERIRDREARLLDFLVEPRSVDEMVAHRFVYRPHDQAPGVDPVERRSADLHLARLERDGRVARVDGDRWIAVA